MLRKTLASVMALAFFGAVAADGVVAADKQAAKGKLVVTGSSTVAPLVSEIAKRFEQMNPAVRIDVQTGGSSRGIADAREGAADIGMVSRDLKPDEQGLDAFPIALDGICLITHKTNPVESLSNEQIVGIFTGKITNWKDVGGKNAPITVVNKAEGRATLELFLHYFKLKSPDIKAQVVIGDNEQGVKTVAGNSNAIGYVSIGTAEYDESRGVPVKLLAMNGVEASLKNVKAGTFPIARHLNLVTKPNPSGLIKQFIEFAKSDRVSDLVSEQYFVSIAK